MYIKEIKNCHITRISNGWIVDASGEWNNGEIYSPGRVYFKELKDATEHVENLEKRQ